MHQSDSRDQHPSWHQKCIQITGFILRNLRPSRVSRTHLKAPPLGLSDRGPPAVNHHHVLRRAAAARRCRRAALPPPYVPPEATGTQVSGNDLQPVHHGGGTERRFPDRFGAPVWTLDSEPWTRPNNIRVWWVRTGAAEGQTESGESFKPAAQQRCCAFCPDYAMRLPSDRVTWPQCHSSWWPIRRKYYN